MKKRIVKRISIAILVVILISGSIGAYRWFKPHRDVQATKAYAAVKVHDLINEFNANEGAANAKYLASDGNSKVLIVEGRISKISTNQDGETMILLKEDGAKVGVSATFTKQTSINTAGIKEGVIIKVKGAITAGNSYDSDLDLYEHAVLVQCDIVK